MTSALLVMCGLFAAAPEADPNVNDLAAYDAAKMKVGRDADSQVKLALWCEARGLKAERVKHLALAVLADPKNATARGLMGLVNYGDRWKRPEVVAERVKADEELSAKLAAYNGRREKTAETAEAQWKLAVWCQETGLDAEARAHFTTVIRLDPAREAAWKRLGYKKQGGRWVTDERLAAERAEGDARKAADKYWRPLVLKWHTAFSGKSQSKRVEAETSLDQISDPRAVPALWEVFAKGDEKSQTKVVEILSRIDGIEASRALATLGVFSRYGEVRRAAVETLRRRDVREVVGWLIAMIRKPIRYEIRRPGGANSFGQLFVEGEDFNALRDYTPRETEFLGYRPERTAPGPEGWNFGVSDAEGNPIFGVGRGIVDFGPGPNYSGAFSNALGNLLAQRPIHAPTAGHSTASASKNSQAGHPAQGPYGLVDFGPTVVSQTPEQLAATAVRAASRRLESDIEAIESGNSAINNANALVLNALNSLTRQDLPPDASTWMSWWADQQGYAFSAASTQAPKPTVVQDVGPGALQSFTFYHSCFRAGTPVRTLTGPRAIDSIAVGDRVLVQETTSGEVRFEPVLAVFHNKPATLYKIDFGSESIWATGIHRFWKAGRGWVMARDLKPNDAVRTLDGIQTVRSVEEGPVEPVFNLEVGGGQSFFVGAMGALVHDNSLIQPVKMPFDAPTVADASASAK